MKNVGFIIKQKWKPTALAKPGEPSKKKKFHSEKVKVEKKVRAYSKSSANQNVVLLLSEWPSAMVATD